MDISNNQYETYGRLVETEDKLILRLETYELLQSAIFDFLYRSQETLDREAIQEILKAIHAFDLRLQSELLALRLEKNTVARHLKKFT